MFTTQMSMIMKNEKKIDQKKLNEELKKEKSSKVLNSLLNAIEQAKRRKNLDKTKDLEIKIVKINYAFNSIRLHSELKELNEIHVFHKNFHEIQQEALPDYTVEFEMIGKLSAVDQLRQTHEKIRKFADYEHYVNAVDAGGYDSEDAIFSGDTHKIDTPKFNFVKRSQYGNGSDFKHKIIEYRGNNCYLATKRYCSFKGNNNLTG